HPGPSAAQRLGPRASADKLVPYDSLSPFVCRMGRGTPAPLDPRRESPDAGSMAIDNTVELLLRLPLFGGLSPPQLAEIVRRAERVRFWPGDVLTKAGQPGDGAYVIVSGPVQRVGGPGIAAMALPEIVVPGSLIGELAMLVEHDYASTIVARDRVFCLKLIRTEM